MPRTVHALLLVMLVALALPAGAAAHTLPAPKEVTAAVASTGVQLGWKDTSDSHVDGYNVYRRTPAGDWAGIARIAANAYTDTGATGGTYRVTTYSDSGKESAPSAEVVAGTGTGAGAAPAAPSPGPADSADVDVTSNDFTAATVDVKPGATVTWHFLEGTHTATSDPGQAESFDSGKLSAGTYSHTFTHTGRFTYVCVRHSGMQGVVIVRDAPTTPDTSAPAAPTGLAATPGNANVTLDWADVDAPDLASYRVERQNLDGSWATIGTPTASTFTDTGLANGATYAYRVSAVDLSGNQSAPSATVTATAAAAATGPADRLVSIAGYAFGPDNLVVNKGDTVVWSWDGPDVNHSVTAGAGQSETFESHPGLADSDVKAAPPGGFRHTFTTAGTFSYLCRVHPDMTGTITVVDGGADALQDVRRPAAAAAAAPAPEEKPAATNHIAKVAQYRFTPAALTVEQGDSVTWLWTGDDKDHSVSTKPGQADSFDSHAGLKTGQITTSPPGNRFVHVFTTLGTFTYICRLHPNMVGTVTVVPHSSAPKATTAAAPLRLYGARASVRGSRIVLRMRSSEKARVRAQLRRGSRLLGTYRFTLRRGTATLRLILPRGARRAGSYRLTLLGVRASGDRSAPVAVTVRVPRRR